ncbi:MAG: histidine phosphatase family protein [Cellvibrionaceae bacterium]|nr:histidine phosphatase family protein [Cellvibrionaceae bacterium]
MTTIILVRHGETVWNVEHRFMGHSDSPLTELGQQQIAALGSRFQSITFSALYSSDSPRALQTAEAIAGKSGKSVQLDQELRERNMGVLQGLNKEELASQYPDYWQTIEAGEYLKLNVPQGESGEEFNTRAVNIFRELARRHQGETIVAVSHGGLICTIFRYVLNLPYGRDIKFYCANTSVSIFSCEDAQWTLETWGDVSHLGKISSQ